MENIINEIAKKAHKLGACQQGYRELLSATSKHDLCNSYIKNLDFCLEHNFPSNEYIRKHFKGIMEEQGIYLDDVIELHNRRMCITLGKTNGRIIAGEYSVVEIYAKHQSTLNIAAKDNAFVMVDVYDDAVVNVCASDRAQVCVNRHGGKVTYNATGDAVVKIREMSNK